MRRELGGDAAQAVECRGVEIERNLPARPRRQSIDLAAERELGAGKIANGKAVDLQFPGIELDRGIDRLRLHPGKRRGTDVERQRCLPGQFESAAAEASTERWPIWQSPTAHRDRALRRAVQHRPAPDDRHATTGRRAAPRRFRPQRSGQPVDCDAVAGNGDVAAGVEGLHLVRGASAAAAIEPLASSVSKSAEASFAGPAESENPAPPR